MFLLGTKITFHAEHVERTYTRVVIQDLRIQVAHACTQNDKKQSKYNVVATIYTLGTNHETLTVHSSAIKHSPPCSAHTPRW